MLRKKKQIEQEREKNPPSSSSPSFPPPAPKTPDREGKSWFDKLKDKVKETLSDLSDEEGQKTHGGGRNGEKNEFAEQEEDEYDPRDSEFGESS